MRCFVYWLFSTEYAFDDYDANNDDVSRLDI